MATTANGIKDSILETIGNTPHVRLSKLPGKDDAEVIAKIESRNPGGSVKDRIGLYMIQEAERQGIISPQKTVIVEPTSGNTGIGLALVAAVKGYRIILTMPETMSVERRKLLAAYGAQIVLTEGPKGMAGAIAKAEEISKENPDVFIPRQFENPANVKAHFETTAQEILRDIGTFDAFVAGVGTGGTITGVAKALKPILPNAKFYAVEPAESAVLSGELKGTHGIQGIGAGFVPKIFDRKYIDGIIKVSTTDALETSRRLAKEEGILSGISAGANAYAAVQLAKKLGKGKRVVVILPDTGERYLSTELFK